MPVLSSQPATVTVADLVRDALLDLGVLSGQEQPSGGMLKDGVRYLNRMLDAWNAERLTVYSVRRETLACDGSQSYDIGPNGDLDTDRPTKLEFAFWVNTDGSEVPVRILTQDEWNRITQKTQAGTAVTDVFYDPTMPTGTLYTFPQASGSLVIGTWTPLAR